MHAELESLALLLESFAVIQERVVHQLQPRGFQAGYSAGLAIAYRQSAHNLRELARDCQPVHLEPATF